MCVNAGAVSVGDLEVARTWSDVTILSSAPVTSLCLRPAGTSYNPGIEHRVGENAHTQRRYDCNIIQSVERVDKSEIMGRVTLPADSRRS